MQQLGTKTVDQVLVRIRRSDHISASEAPITYTTLYYTNIDLLSNLWKSMQANKTAVILNMDYITNTCKKSTNPPLISLERANTSVH